MASIFLMEDNEALRRVLVRTLADEGHEVTQSENGSAAYDDDLLNSIDIMITDLVMPRVDGLEAINTAKVMRKDLKVIAMSGGSAEFNQDYLKVALAFGASNVLQKPFEPEALVNAVNETLVP